MLNYGYYELTYKNSDETNEREINKCTIILIIVSQ